MISVFKFSIPSQNAELHIHQSHKEIVLTDMIKFYTRIRKFEWTLNDTGTGKVISVPIILAKNFFGGFSSTAC